MFNIHISLHISIFLASTSWSKLNDNLLESFPSLSPLIKLPLFQKLLDFPRPPSFKELLDIANPGSTYQGFSTMVNVRESSPSILISHTANKR